MSRGLPAEMDGDGGSRLRVENLHVSIPTASGLIEAVSDVSFELEPGTALGLLGNSGSGKSVTGLSVLGLPPGGRHSIVGGSIRLGSTELTELAEPEMRVVRGGRIAMVFQDPGLALTPVHRIGRLIDDTIRAHLELEGDAVRDRTLALLEEVGLPEPEAAARAYVRELSGGMKQRVMIAIALAGEPSILIADEPTSSLDAIAQDQILGLLERLRRDRGLSLLLISHDLGVMERMADRIAVIERGRTVEAGETARLLREPAETATRVLVEARHPAREPRTPPPSTGASPTVLALEDVKFSYPGREHPAVDDVSLTISRGEILGLVGDSGCGKTTLARCLLRILEPTAGSIEFDGEDITHLSGRSLRSVRAKVGSIFQSPGASLNPRHRVSRILRPVRLSREERRREALRARASATLAHVGLDESHLDRLPGQLSGGQQQRVALARALVGDPELLICDEPFTALDLTLQNQMGGLLKRVQRERGLACLVIAHDLNVIGQIADRVAVMHEGKVIETGDVEEVFASPREPFTRSLLEASRRNAADLPARSPVI